MIRRYLARRKMRWAVREARRRAHWVPEVWSDEMPTFEQFVAYLSKVEHAQED